MKSEIIRFLADAAWVRGYIADPMMGLEAGNFQWQAAEAEACRQFDEWREKANPQEIFAANFGRVTGRSLEQPSYCYIEVFYCK